MRKFLPLFLFLLAGCVTTWTQVGGPYISETQNFSLELPAGWMKSNTSKYFSITRDGWRLQYIVVEVLDTNTELKYTQKKYVKGMSPQEATAIFMEHLSSNPSLGNLEMEENSPVSINGLPGFKLAYAYKDQNGLRIRCIDYGLPADEKFYLIRYSAPARYYFDKDLNIFEKVVQSFKLHSSSPADSAQEVQKEKPGEKK